MSAESRRNTDTTPRVMTAVEGVLRLGATCRRARENGIMLSRDMEQSSRVPTSTFESRQTRMFVSAMATTMRANTGPSCWLMISSIGEGESARADGSLIASTYTRYIANSITHDTANAYNIMRGITRRASFVSSATSATASTPTRPKNGPSEADNQARMYGVASSGLLPTKSDEIGCALSGMMTMTTAMTTVTPTVTMISKLTPILLMNVAKRTRYALMITQTVTTAIAIKICWYCVSCQPNTLPK